MRCDTRSGRRAQFPSRGNHFIMYKWQYDHGLLGFAINRYRLKKGNKIPYQALLRGNMIHEHVVLHAQSMRDPPQAPKWHESEGHHEDLLVVPCREWDNPRGRRSPSRTIYSYPLLSASAYASDREVVRAVSRKAMRAVSREAMRSQAPLEMPQVPVGEKSAGSQPAVAGSNAPARVLASREVISRRDSSFFADRRCLHAVEAAG